ncbi:uncharacterized protein LOC112590626 [Harpegnathos saltator]|uniref:Uncharacterized protein n=1 Tax=Harpegnathos saltator TaxID=610380 RepID=E2BEX6_HARSA|nr:uncharacterized protein LOC112590626 [Harpegnathos saltator]EFN85741.1 hypothetical protein EAI_09901 [Harpegnathos saltator]
MRPTVIQQKYASEERINDGELDLLLEVGITDDASASSRRPSNECHVPSVMDRDDFWEVTIVPSLQSSQATSSNDTLWPSVRVLNTELETKRGLCSSTGGRRRREEGRSTYERLNREDSRGPFKSGKRSTFALHGSEQESDGRTNEKLGDTPSPGTLRNNGSQAPFVELGAVRKVLDFIAGSDPKVSSLLTNNYCSEISRTLRYFIALRRDKKLDDLLSKDSSLHRCERCGVISRLLKSCHGAGVATAERDCVDDYESTGKLQIPTSQPSVNYNARSGMSADAPEGRAECKDGPSERLAVQGRRSFVIRRRAAGPNDANNISNAEGDAKIKNTSHLNNDVIRRLFVNYEAANRDARHEFGNAAGVERVHHDGVSTTTKTNTDVEKVVRNISYENKWQIDSLPTAALRCRNTRRTQSLRRLLDMDADITSVADTMKYLALGQVVALDKEQDGLLSELQGTRYTRLEEPSKRQSSVLYSSRDDYPRCEPGFWLFDESGHLTETAWDEHRCLPVARLDENSNDPRACNVGRREPKKADSWIECMEKDSLEDCAPLGRREESDIMTFSSSSAEHLIHEWMGALDEEEDTDGDIQRGRPLVSSRPSLNIAQHVRAEIAQARRSDNAKEARDEPGARGSSVLARLSAKEARNEVCHSIAVEDSVRASCRAKNSATDTDATFTTVPFPFAHPDQSLRASDKITNAWLGDCIPTKLSESPEDKSCSIEEPDVVQTSHGQSESKAGQPAAVVCPDSSGKIARCIIYKNASPGSAGKDVGRAVAEISPVYRDVLESSESMDWDDFRRLIERLHPGQRELWSDVCKAVDEEAERVAGDANGSVEVCIEISPVVLDGNLKTNKPMACAREVAFELDMSLKDAESFLGERPRLVEERLDIHKDADEGVTDRNGLGRKATPE